MLRLRGATLSSASSLFRPTTPNRFIFKWFKNKSQGLNTDGSIASGTAAATARALKSKQSEEEKYSHPLDPSKEMSSSSASSSSAASSSSTSSKVTGPGAEKTYSFETYHENEVKPDQRKDVYREREWWEYTPSPEHTSLVLLLYRSLLKELVKLPTVRKRTFITYVRLTFRRRAKATEKLLIDECIEEARRGIYVAAKHNAMKETGEYKFDDMFMPKDTGQDVKSFMEEVYDPVMSKRAMENAKDVGPGNENTGNTLRGAHYQTDRLARESMKEQLERPAITEEDLRLRPPAPPGQTQQDSK